MAASIKVLLSFIHGRLEKMRDIGKEHNWKTSQGTLKNATIAANIIDEVIDMRYDPVNRRIVEHEQVPFLIMTRRLWAQYAAQKGYIRKRNET